MHLGNEEAESSEEICKLFAKKFARVFSNEPINEDEIQAAANNVPRSFRSLSAIDIDEDVLSAVQFTGSGRDSLDTAKAMLTGVASTSGTPIPLISRLR